MDVLTTPGARQDRRAPDAPRSAMHEVPASPRGATRGLATALGWFSIGLGAAELLAPGALVRFLGTKARRRTRSLMRALGAREVVSGVGLLFRESPGNWVRARVAGDAMDLALLGGAMMRNRGRRARVTAVAAAVLGVAAFDLVLSARLRNGRGRLGRPRLDHGIMVDESVTVGRPPEEVYRFWRDFENLPRFMRHLESVEVLAEGRSHWKARAPGGMSAEWDATIMDDRPNEMISWRSIAGDVDHVGSVWFRPAPGDRGTEVRVRLRYDPPGGRVTAALAKLFREEPSQQVRDDLRAFKQVMETGEVLRSDATLRRGPHPAQPMGVDR